MNEDKRAAQQLLLNPIVIIALLIVLGTFSLIGSAIFGLDHGVLSSLAKLDFARGLITYLFAVVTIGTAVALVVSALTSEASEEMEKRFQRGKEILSLLLGLFGTIVGFYFASDISGREQIEIGALHVTPPLLNEQRVISGQQVTVTAAVSGGTPLYRYGVTMGEDKEIQYDQSVRENGWIVHKLMAPTVSEIITLDVKLGVKDATDRALTTSAKLEVAPKPAAP